jgi:two-component system, chemotaxis family, sensor kinase CheA
MKFSGAERSRQIVTAALGALLLLVMGGVLIMGFRLATQMTGNISALQSASALQTYPNIIAQQLNALRDRLEARTYAGQALTDLRATVQNFDGEINKLAASGFGRSPQLDRALLSWKQYSPLVMPVVSFRDQPYIESDDAGSAFSTPGLAHYAEVKKAQLFARENTQKLQRQLAAVASALQSQASAEANRLRWLLSVGVVAALILAAAAGYLQLTRGKSERLAREAQEQTRDILKTVREGFFLIDSDYRIGSVWSEELTRMFGRRDFSGLSFEDLLSDRVSENTLATAIKYIKLLWGERANENLMKSINPLAQLEIQVENSHGGRDTRYLQFDFHRVMGEKGVKQVLVSVSDVTSSVLLSRELAESQQNANQQVDMMLGVIHLDPSQLISFLDSTDVSVQHINAIMRKPARTDSEFRGKLDGMFRELHSIKGEASAVNMPSVAHRVHALEDMITDIKKIQSISGNEFLPMVLKLDELITHLRSVRELASRLTSIHHAVKSSDSSSHTDTAIVQNLQPVTERLSPKDSAPEPTISSELGQTLNNMAERLAADHQKNFKLTANGLTDVPKIYRQVVREVVIQMLRNSAVHGIETADVRLARTKAEMGLIRVDFRRTAEGFELIFEDDGAGLNPDELKATAIRKQLITPQEAEQLDSRGTMALIFKPGFSTKEEVSMDAGRGVGMDVVARSIQTAGGKIGIATKRGKFTRFKITFPGVDKASEAVA